MAEMTLRFPLFKGRDYKDQLRCITNIISVSAVPASLANSGGVAYLEELLSPVSSHNGLRRMFPDGAVSDEFIDLLSRMLEFDPKMRITAAAALHHPFFASIHQPNSEEARPASHSVTTLDCEQPDLLTADQLRAMMWHQVDQVQAGK